MLQKFCVFCGNKPVNKTHEHIIPQWLINLTGDPNRKISLGIDLNYLKNTNSFKEKKISFSSFKFPSCEICNNEFSDMESQVKVIMEKILCDDFLSSTELHVLLNWFDKVRIGLWLGFLMLHKEIIPVNPKFHIKKRIGEKDRCLFIYKIDENWRGVQFIGINSPVFYHTPSCFCLHINNYYFFNSSFEFLFARNIGFPFPISQSLNPLNIKETYAKLSNGLNKFRLPLIKRNLIMPSIEIYQPMFGQRLNRQLDSEIMDIYNCDYVKNNCIDFLNGIGAIFYIEENNLQKIDIETEVCCGAITSNIASEGMPNIMTKQVLDMQAYLQEKIPSMIDLNPEDRKIIMRNQRNLLDLQKRFRKLLDMN